MTDEHIYLAGPMRRIPEFNFPAFFDAARKLRALGHEVCNPAEYDVEVLGFEWQERTGHEDLADLGFDLRQALTYDLEWICKHATMVVTLPGWSSSKGARAEVAVAGALGIPVCTPNYVLYGAEDANPDYWSVPS